MNMEDKPYYVYTSEVLSMTRDGGVVFHNKDPYDEFQPRENMPQVPLNLMQVKVLLTVLLVTWSKDAQQWAEFFLTRSKVVKYAGTFEPLDSNEPLMYEIEEWLNTTEVEFELEGQEGIVESFSQLFKQDVKLIVKIPYMATTTTQVLEENCVSVEDGNGMTCDVSLAEVLEGYNRPEEEQQTKYARQLLIAPRQQESERIEDDAIVVAALLPRLNDHTRMVLEVDPGVLPLMDGVVGGVVVAEDGFFDVQEMDVRVRTERETGTVCDVAVLMSEYAVNASQVVRRYSYVDYRKREANYIAPSGAKYKVTPCWKLNAPRGRLGTCPMCVEVDALWPRKFKFTVAQLSVWRRLHLLARRECCAIMEETPCQFGLYPIFPRSALGLNDFIHQYDGGVGYQGRLQQEGKIETYFNQDGWQGIVRCPLKVGARQYIVVWMGKRGFNRQVAGINTRVACEAWQIVYREDVVQGFSRDALESRLERMWEERSFVPPARVRLEQVYGLCRSREGESSDEFG